ESGEGQLASVIEQCLFSFQNGDVDSFGEYLDPIEQVNLTRLRGGASGSQIFRCELYGALRNRNCAFVLKLDTVENIRREETRYNQFVRLQLPHNLRVELVGSGYSRDRAGILYGFAFGGQREVTTATDLLSAGKTRPLHNLLELLSAGQSAGWYQLGNKTP